MCGLVGIIGGDQSEFLMQNLYLLKQRGPDSQGVLNVENKLTLGATRLSMTDPLTRSNQPMKDEVSKNIIVFNGEIFNFRGLRKQLITDGYKFVTESDTEVVLKGLSHYGIKFVEELEGMFAMAFYNYIDQTLILARDYLGKKPLYYSKDSTHFIFSSQLNIIRKFLKSTTTDECAVSTYLKLGYFVSPRTIYTEVKSLEPGEIITVDIDSLRIVRKTRFVPKAIMNSNNLEIDGLVKSAINQRIIGHNKFALSLSGGIDSSIIALECAKLGVDFHAYTVRWPDSDKAKYNQDFLSANTLSKNLGIKFTAVDMVGFREIPAQIDNYIEAVGEPNSNPVGLSMMKLYSEIAKDGYRLVLTGDGSDEIFAGYKRYSLIKRFDKFPIIDNGYLLETAKKFSITPNSIQKILLTFTDSNSLNFWYHWQDLASDTYLRKFYPRYLLENSDIPIDDFYNKIINYDSKVANTMMRDLRIWLTMESNVRLDRVAMFHSIEARSPFQSEELIGAAYDKLAQENFKILNKTLLTQFYSYSKFLPSNTIKQGFESPLGYWLRNNPELILTSLKYIKTNFDFNSQMLDKLTNSPKKGQYKNFRFLWSLIILSRWHQSAKV